MHTELEKNTDKCLWGTAVAVSDHCLWWWAGNWMERIVCRLSHRGDLTLQLVSEGAGSSSQCGNIWLSPSCSSPCVVPSCSDWDRLSMWSKHLVSKLKSTMGYVPIGLPAPGRTSWLRDQGRAVGHVAPQSDPTLGQGTKHELWASLYTRNLPVLQKAFGTNSFVLSALTGRGIIIVRRMASGKIHK